MNVMLRLQVPDNRSDGAFGWTFDAVAAAGDQVFPLGWSTTVSREDAEAEPSAGWLPPGEVEGLYERAARVADERFAAYIAGRLAPPENS